MAWFPHSTMYFSFNGDSYLYYFLFAVTASRIVFSHYNNSVNFVGLIYDLNWCKTGIKPFWPLRFHSQQRVSEVNQMTLITTCHVTTSKKSYEPCSHLAKHICISPCFCQPGNDRVCYHIQGKCFIRLVLQPLKTFLNKFVISCMVLFLLSPLQEDAGISKCRFTPLFFSSD